jgi:hypothetical protein
MRRSSLVAAAIVVTALVFSAMGGAVANHQPANKVSVAASNIQTMETVALTGAQSNIVELFNETLKTSAPEDLILQLTAECALVTNIVNVGNSDSQAIASVRVWMEIDGSPVIVASDGPGSPAEQAQVVFCNRAFRMVITDLDDQDAQFRQYLQTRNANAFNWMALNVGSGIHNVVVKAQLEAAVTGAGEARAMIGKRSLVIEPTKLINDAVI